MACHQKEGHNGKFQNQNQNNKNTGNLMQRDDIDKSQLMQQHSPSNSAASFSNQSIENLQPIKLTKKNKKRLKKLNKKDEKMNRPIIWQVVAFFCLKKISHI